MNRGFALVVGGVIAGVLVYWFVLRSPSARSHDGAVRPDAALGGAAGAETRASGSMPSPVPGPPTLGARPALPSGDGRGSAARHEGIDSMRSAGALAHIPDHYTLAVTATGQKAINLAGGEPTVFRAAGGIMGITEQPSGRTLHGRVVDASGKPVPGAIVLVDAQRLDVLAANLMGDAGAAADAAGDFTIENAPPNPANAMAIDPQGGWSDLVPVSDAPMTLTLRGHGALHGRATYNGKGESFSLELVQAAPPFLVFYESDADGTFTFASLRPGDYTLTCGLAQASSGGVSQKSSKLVTITAGQTTEVTFDQVSKAIVAVIGAPMGKNIMEYWLFSGAAAPAAYAAAKTREESEHAPYQLIGGQDHEGAMQFHDIGAGAYVACVASDLGVAFGCQDVTVMDGDAVKEVNVVIQAGSAAK